VEQASKELAKGLYLQVSLGTNKPHEINQIAEILKTSPGSCPVFLSVRDYAKNLCVLKLGRAFQVNPNRFPVEELEEILGQGNVKLS
jgi:DNA polymerase-3 subunit alpha